MQSSVALSLHHRISVADWAYRSRDPPEPRHEEHASRWVCELCPGVPTLIALPTFDTVESWISHFKDHHDANFSAEELRLEASLCERSVLEPINCPLCRTGRLNLEQDEHIGNHLRVFALRALPWNIPYAIHHDDEDMGLGEGVQSSHEPVFARADTRPTALPRAIHQIGPEAPVERVGIVTGYGSIKPSDNDTDGVSNKAKIKAQKSVAPDRSMLSKVEPKGDSFVLQPLEEEIDLVGSRMSQGKGSREEEQSQVNAHNEAELDPHPLNRWLREPKVALAWTCDDIKEALEGRTAVGLIKYFSLGVA